MVILVPALMLGLMLRSGNPPPHSRSIRARDGTEAVLRYDAGFLGRDYTVVTVKRNDTCHHVKVFWHQGPSDFDDVKLEWNDDLTLAITYHARLSDPSYCATQANGVTVVCTSLEWPRPSD